jgi:hypothetical protein
MAPKQVGIVSGAGTGRRLHQKVGKWRNRADPDVAAESAFSLAPSFCDL